MMERQEQAGQGDKTYWKTFHLKGWACLIRGVMSSSQFRFGTQQYWSWTWCHIAYTNQIFSWVVPRFCRPSLFQSRRLFLAWTSRLGNGEVSKYLNRKFGEKIVSYESIMKQSRKEKGFLPQYLQEIARMSMNGAISRKNCFVTLEPFETILMLSRPKSCLRCGKNSRRNLGYKNGSPPAKLSFLIPASFSNFNPCFASSDVLTYELVSVWKQKPHS